MDYLSANTEQAAQQLAEILESNQIDVPVLPETAHRVITLTQDADSDASQLASIIQSDPTLGGHVMRIANSAAYTPNSNLVSIQQAITRLGMVEIANIALSTSLNSKMFNAPGYEQHIVAIWQQALATALWSKEVARAMRSNVEAAFLCGLLHIIGQPVILQTLADQHKSSPILSDEELGQLYQDFEALYGQTVAETWELPEIVGEAISFYKNFKEAPSASELAATIAFGSQVAQEMLSSDEIDKDPLLNSPALDLINLYPDEIEKLLEKASAIKSSMDTLSS